VSSIATKLLDQNKNKNYACFLVFNSKLYSRKRTNHKDSGKSSRLQRGRKASPHRHLNNTYHAKETIPQE